MNDLRTITPKRDIARELARKYSTMTHDELDILEGILEPVKYGKGEMILAEGEVCRGISYIEKGLVRQFYNKNGKEVTEHLGVDHTIFMCIESLFKEEPSRLQVEALEATLVYILPKSKLEAAAIRNVNIQMLYRKILEESHPVAGSCRPDAFRDCAQQIQASVRTESSGGVACSIDIHCQLSANDSRDIVPHPFGCVAIKM